LEKRIKSGSSVRLAEEEGLYIGEPIRIADSNWHRIQHRLLSENEKFVVHEFICKNTMIVMLKGYFAC